MIGKLALKKEEIYILAWLILAIFLIAIFQLRTLGYPFIHQNAQVSAASSVIARSFTEQGIFKLGGVPLYNNFILGAYPDAYIHWPPLFQIILSFAFRLFGESEAVARSLMFLILIANGLMIYFLVKKCGGRIAALFASFVILSMPVTFLFSGAILPLNLALFFTIAAVFAFVKALENESLKRNWALLGIAAMVLAVWTSWEPIFVPLGLLALAIWRRQRAHISLASIYMLSAILAFVSVLALYYAKYPDLFKELWNVFLFRTQILHHDIKMQFNIYTFVSILHHKEYAFPSILELIKAHRFRLEPLLGTGGIVGLCWLLIIGLASRQNLKKDPIANPVFGFLAMWVGWFIVMNNQAYTHDCELLLALPVTAIAAGASFKWFLSVTGEIRHGNDRLIARLFLFVVFPAAIILPLAKTTYRELRTFELIDPYVYSEYLYGLEIKKATQPKEVILLTRNGSVSVYYSKRHCVRGIRNDEALKEVVGYLPGIFKNLRVYLAILPDKDYKDKFRESLRRYPEVYKTDNLILLKIQ